MLSSWKSESDNSVSTSALDGNGAIGTKTAPANLKSTITGKPQKANQSIVDESLTMKGDLESEAGILVKGKVIGNIKCKVLIVDTGARVDGGIEAEEVIVRGTVRGEIKADRVHLEQTADVECDIYQNTFLAEEGARILGALKSKSSAKDAGDKKSSAQMDIGKKVTSQ